MEKKFKQIESSGTIQERAKLIADAIRQSSWFQLGGPEATNFLFYLTYRRFLQPLPDGVFSSWQERPYASTGQKPTFWDFLDHYFEGILDEHRIQSIRDFESKPDLLALMESMEGAMQADSDQAYQELFEFLLMSLMGGDFSSPEFPAPLAKLTIGLFNLPPNAILQNPYAGRGSLIPYLPDTIIYRGDETDAINLAIMHLRLLVHGHKKTKLDGLGVFNQTMEKATISICLPPFSNEFVAFPPRQGETSEDIPERLVGDLLRGVSKTGKVMLVTNTRFLTGSNAVSKALQKALVNSKFLSTIISLPAKFLEQAGRSCSLVILDKEHEPNGPVSFLKLVNPNKAASQWQFEELDVEGTIERFRKKRLGTEEFEIPLEKIISGDYQLSPKWEMLESILKVEMAQAEKGLQFLGLDELLLTVYPIEGGISGLPLIMLHSVKSAEPFYRLTRDQLQKMQVAVRDIRGYQRFSSDQTTLLAPRLGPNGKHAILDANAQEVAISSDLLCFQLKGSYVDIEYLVLELSSSFVKEQLDVLVQGMMVPRISGADFLSIKVRVPSPQQQRRLVEQFKRASYAAKVEQLKLHQKMLGLERSEHQILAVIGHELRPIIYKVQKQASWLKAYLSKKESEGESVSLKDYVGHRHASKTVEGTIASIVQDMNIMGQRFDSLQMLLDIEDKKGQLEVVTLKNFWWLAEEYGDGPWNRPFFLHHYTEPHPENKALMVKVNRDLFKIVIRNLVRNAEVHGFDKSMEGNKVHLEASHIHKEDGTIWVVVDCLNNGKPFPEGFKFEEIIQFGTRGTDSKGTGVGGFLINRIIHEFGGHFRLLEQDEIDTLIGHGKSKIVEAFRDIVYEKRPYQVGFRIELPYCAENDENLD